MLTTVTDGSAAAASDDAGWVLVVSRGTELRAVGLPERGAVVIGRDPTCDVAIEHEKLSRRHARVVLGERWTVEDLGSRNGTVVRGVAVVEGEPVELVPGEPFAIGPFAAVIVARAVSTVRATLGGSHVTIEDPTLTTPSPLMIAVARSPVSVVILGETGAGKEVLAHALHRLSGRTGPLLAVNCAALAPQLLASELFGHEKGSFTGATTTHVGLLEAAAGGTVLFDEIGELPLELQAKLLRAIEAREVLRVGAVKAIAIDVRFLAATHRDLLAASVSGGFRRDLFYRLAGLTLLVPPLRSRPQQLAALAARFARDATGRADALTPAAMARLRAHEWPGNVRELKNVLERAALLAGGGAIGAEHILIDAALNPNPYPNPNPGRAGGTPSLVNGRGPEGDVGPNPSPNRQGPEGDVGRVASPSPSHGLEPAQLAERARIVAALEACAGNQTHAARRLGMSRATLVHKLALLRIPRPRKGTDGA